MTEPKERDGEQEMEKWQFVIQAGNEIEANIIESIFDSEGIPVQKKYCEAGEYLKIYMGMTNFGVDIYVPESQIEKATSLLNTAELEDEI